MKKIFFILIIIINFNCFCQENSKSQESKRLQNLNILNLNTKPEYNNFQINPPKELLKRPIFNNKTIKSTTIDIDRYKEYKKELNKILIVK